MRYLNIFILEILIILSLGSCVLNETDSPVSISGKISNSSGSGLTNVTIKINTSSDEITTKTDIEGKYTVTLPSGCAAFITYKKEGYTPQTRNTSLKGGDHKTIDLQMNSLKEDAFFKVNIDDSSVKNRKGSLQALINTNVNYEFECKDSWVKCNKTQTNFYIDYDENETLTTRTAIITLKADYGLTHVIKVIQDAGPVLRLTDYIGKDNTTNFLTSLPYISFNREVKLVSVKSSDPNIDLSSQYSEDKKTIYFPNIKLEALSPATISYTVEASDAEKIENSFELRAYEARINAASHNGQKLLFTKDGKHCWLYTCVNWGQSSLVQYSTDDLTETGRVPFKQNDYSDFIYNRYNDCLYVLRNFSDNKNIIDIYDASTTKFVKSLDLSSNLLRDPMGKMGFADNGFGLIFSDKICSINSADNHKLDFFADNSFLYEQGHPDMLIPREVDVCNNGKMLVLTKEVEIGDVYTVDSESKELKHYYNIWGNYYATNNLYSGVVLGSYYYKNVTYIDFLTGEKRSITTDNVSQRGDIIATGNQYPTLLTSSLSTISFQTGQERKFKIDNMIYIICSSDDGKKLAILYNDMFYLFKSEVFTLYSNKIQ